MSTGHKFRAAPSRAGYVRGCRCEGCKQRSYYEQNREQIAEKKRSYREQNRERDQISLALAQGLSNRQVMDQTGCTYADLMHVLEESA